MPSVDPLRTMVQSSTGTISRLTQSVVSIAEEVKSRSSFYVSVVERFLGRSFGPQLQFLVMTAFSGLAVTTALASKAGYLDSAKRPTKVTDDHVTGPLGNATEGPNEQRHKEHFADNGDALSDISNARRRIIELEEEIAASAASHARRAKAFESTILEQSECIEALERRQLDAEELIASSTSKISRLDANLVAGQQAQTKGLEKLESEKKSPSSSADTWIAQLRLAEEEILRLKTNLVKSNGDIGHLRDELDKKDVELTATRQEHGQLATTHKDHIEASAKGVVGMQSCIEELREKRNDLESAIGEKDRAIADKDTSMKTTLDNVTILKTRIAYLETNTSTQQEELIRLRGHNEEKSSEVARTQQMVENIQAQQQDAFEELKQVKSQLHAEQETATKLREIHNQNMSESTSSVDRLEQALRHVETELETTQNRLREKTQAFDESTMQMRSEHETSTKALQSMLEDQKNTSASLEGKLQSALASCNRQSQDSAHFLADLRKEHAEVLLRVRDAHTKKQASLELEISATVSSRDSLKQVEQNLNSQLTAANVSLDRTRSKAEATLQRRRAEHEAAIASFRGEFENMKSLHEAEILDLTESQQSEAEYMTKAVTSSRTEAMRLKGELDLALKRTADLESKIFALQADSERSFKALEAQKAEQAQLQHTMESSRVAVSRLEADLREVAQQKVEISQEKADVERAADAKIETMNRRLAESEALFADQRTAATRTSSQLSADLEKSFGTHAALAQTNESLSQKVKALESQVSEQGNMIASLQDLLGTPTSEQPMPMHREPVESLQLKSQLRTLREPAHQRPPSSSSIVDIVQPSVRSGEYNHYSDNSRTSPSHYSEQRSNPPQTPGGSSTIEKPTSADRMTIALGYTSSPEAEILDPSRSKKENRILGISENNFSRPSTNGSLSVGRVPSLTLTPSRTSQPTQPDLHDYVATGTTTPAAVSATASASASLDYRTPPKRSKGLKGLLRRTSQKLGRSPSVKSGSPSTRSFSVGNANDVVRDSPSGQDRSGAIDSLSRQVSGSTSRWRN